jgi:hypothetical protein
MLSITLYQTSGTALGNGGSLNITDLKGGKVGIGAAIPGANLDSMFASLSRTTPIICQVLRSDVIMPSDLSAPAPSGNDLNIIDC